MIQASIKSLHGRQVWSSAGLPTLEVEISLNSGAVSRAIAPMGISGGKGKRSENYENFYGYLKKQLSMSIVYIQKNIAPNNKSRQSPKSQYEMKLEKTN